MRQPHQANIDTHYSVAYYDFADNIRGKSASAIVSRIVMSLDTPVSEMSTNLHVFSMSYSVVSPLSRSLFVIIFLFTIIIFTVADILRRKWVKRHFKWSKSMLLLFFFWKIQKTNVDNKSFNV